MKNVFIISWIIVLTFFIYSCKKEKPVIPVLITTEVTEISYTTAISGGSVTDEGGAPVVSRGVCWNTSEDPTIANTKTIETGGLGSFTSSIAQLTPNTMYFVRAYATNIAGTGYGNPFMFITRQVLTATLSTKTINSITHSTAVSGGNILVDNGGAVTARGVCWSTSQNPTTSDTKTTDGTGTGSFDSNLSGLQPGTVYYVRSYATNSAGTAYGNEISFTTTTTVPTLTTIAASSITGTTATSGGNVTSAGGATITARGVCWSISANPTIAISKTTDGTETGVFTSSVTGLSAVTIYYLRAYATNSAGTAYGNEISFTTSAATLPILTTASVSSVTGTTATCGGNISSDGGAVITARGVCWSISANPTITSSKTTDGAGTGIFASSVTGLSAVTIYYLRAYATNSAGTAYGNEVSFTTTATVPTLTTAAASLIAQNTATCGGNVTSDGGASVTARGVCWSTSPNPIITGNRTTDGTGIGAFTSSLTTLTAGTTYYVRAYATNSAGTAYGDGISFTTNPATLPVLTTSEASSIAQSSATGGGNVTSDGGATITDRGVYYGTSQDPETTGTKLQIGSGTGSFSTSLSGLSPNITYYVKAYAINSQGKAYGNEITFTLWINQPGPQVVFDGYTYNSVKIGNQIWITENLKTTKYADGTPITFVNTNGTWDALTTTSKAYCWYDDNIGYKDIYGALYTWAAAMKGAASSNTNPSGIQGICPTGWHLPSDEEWMTLEIFLGMEPGQAYALFERGTTEGGKMKETGTTHWIPNTGATNESGFMGLPGSYRNDDGTSNNITSYGSWWSSSEYSTSQVYHRLLFNINATVYRAVIGKEFGVSVRCVKDN